MASWNTMRMVLFSLPGLVPLVRRLLLVPLCLAL